MAGQKVISGDLRLKFDDENIYHSINCSLEMSRETKPRATKDTTGVEVSKGTKSASISGDGLAVYLGDGNDGLIFNELFDKWNDDTTTLVDFEFLPGEADATFKYSGECIITSLSMSAPNDEDATISFSADVSGEITKTAIV